MRAYRRAGPWLENLAALGRGDASERGSPGAGATDELLCPQIVDGIPVTSPTVTLVDLATCLPSGELEAAINEADHRRLVSPDTLRSAIDGLPGRPGVRPLRTLLDTSSHALTTTALERYFLPLAHSAGLPPPRTQVQLGRHRVDFYWVDLGLIVETDSLRYHRTAFKQAADKRRDNEHAGSGLTTLRFTHGQVRYEPGYVRAELRRVARRLRPAGQTTQIANG